MVEIREDKKTKYLDIRYSEKNIEEHKLFAQKFAEWVHKRFFKSKGKLLDVGCGKGVYVDGFNSMGYEAIGIDKEQTRNDVVVVDLEKDKIPFPDNSFDYVLCKGVIHTINNTDNMLKEIIRVLKPNGLVFIMTIDWENTYKTFYVDFTVKKPYTLESLRDVLIYYGFSVIEARKFQNIPYIWRYTTKAFDIIHPNPKSIFVIASV
jgi:ubiquinone/menaquinone biosynthesis C-methylase UbiE